MGPQWAIELDVVGQMAQQVEIQRTVFSRLQINKKSYIFDVTA